MLFRSSEGGPDWILSNTILGVTPSTFQKEATAEACLLCAKEGRLKKFGFATRKYHCHNCGNVVCATCSVRKCRLPTETDSLVRVCNECWTRLSKMKLHSTHSIRARRFGSEATDLVFLLAEIPACLWNFKSLVELNLSSNLLKVLPPEIGAMTNLYSLNLEGNLLEVLPNELGKCRALVSLVLSENKLITLPETLGQLQQLILLDCSNNCLTSLPQSVNELAALVTLKLNNNLNLETMPRMHHLNRLQLLHAANTRIQKVFGDTQNVPDLTEFDLSRSSVSDLPISFHELTALRVLHLNATLMVQLPTVATRLELLVELHVDGHKHFSLPREIGNMTSLRVLSARNNQLTELPDTIGKLQSLEQLYLQENDLVRLPQTLGRLSALSVLDVSNNPLTSPPVGVASRGAQAILSYLRNLEKEGGTKVARLKVLVMGDAGVGKTALISSILRDRPSLSVIPTMGIETHLFEPDVQSMMPRTGSEGDTQNLCFDIWDFSGAEAYTTLNQFFYSRERTIYLLIFDLSQPIEISRVQHWYNTVAECSPGVTVIVVATKIDRCKDGKTINALAVQLKACIEKAHNDLQEQLKRKVCALSPVESVTSE